MLRRPGRCRGERAARRRARRARLPGGGDPRVLRGVRGAAGPPARRCAARRGLPPPTGCAVHDGALSMLALCRRDGLVLDTAGAALRRALGDARGGADPSLRHPLLPRRGAARPPRRRCTTTSRRSTACGRRPAEAMRARPGRRAHGDAPDDGRASSCSRGAPPLPTCWRGRRPRPPGADRAPPRVRRRRAASSAPPSATGSCRSWSAPAATAGALASVRGPRTCPHPVRDQITVAGAALGAPRLGGERGVDGGEEAGRATGHVVGAPAELVRGTSSSRASGDRGEGGGGRTGAVRGSPADRRRRRSTIAGSSGTRPSSGTSICIGEGLTAADAEQRVLVAVVVSERAHVLDHARRPARSCAGPCRRPAGPPSGRLKPGW